MRKIGLLGWLLLLPGAAMLLTQSQAQVPPAGQPVVPAAKRDGSKLPAPAQPIFYSAHRALDWLKLTNKPDGRFVYGFLPSLRVPMEGDNFLSQAGATFALARASRYFHDERGTAIARQAALTLLMETAVDQPKEPMLRWTAAPPAALNRLASHGLLILAIHDLDAPAKEMQPLDLLQQADQLCNYLRKQQREDGFLLPGDGGDQIKLAAHTEQDGHHYPAGLALHAVIRSQHKRPADWKIEYLRKAQAYYYTAWKSNKQVMTVVSHTPAYAEAYLLTREPAFAETVFAMNDWLLGLQYSEADDSSRKHWVGGFQRLRLTEGRTELTGPDVGSALAAESLAEACRVAKRAGDLPRLRRYERALMLNLHFLMSLQYSSARTQHFVEPFRPAILGAFHGSHQDGNLRLDYTQHPLSAMVQYLETVVE